MADSDPDSAVLESNLLVCITYHKYAFWSKQSYILFDFGDVRVRTTLVRAVLRFQVDRVEVVAPSDE